MNSDWVMWAAFSASLVGTGAMLAGILDGWRRYAAHRLWFAGVALAILGNVAMIGMGLVQNMVSGLWNHEVQSLGTLAFFGGRFLSDPAFLWAQLVSRREEAELQRGLAERGEI